MSLYLGDNLISGVAYPTEPSRNIGQIIQSTIPLSDAGLHLLDGSLISGSGSYSAFVDYIADLYDSGDYTAIFETEANWQQAVSTYGVCGKFVYDSVNNTVRLPKYSNKIYTSDISSTAPVKGSGMTLGLTNGTVNYGLIYTTPGGNQALQPNATAYASAIPSNGFGTPNFPSLNDRLGITSDASQSGIIADLSNITTSLEGYYYIVVATSSKTDIQVDIDEIATDLNGKADADLSNINASQSVKNTIVAWGIPDYSAGVSISSPYTVTTLGLVVCRDSATPGWAEISVNGEQFENAMSGNVYGAFFAAVFVDVGDTVTIVNGNATFYPLKGAN